MLLFIPRRLADLGWRGRDIKNRGTEDGSLAIVGKVHSLSLLIFFLFHPFVLFNF